MRFIVGFLIIFTVLVDFSTQERVEELCSHSDYEMSVLSDYNSVNTDRMGSKAASTTGHPTEQHTCHAGHLHVAVVLTSLPPTINLPFILILNYFDSHSDFPSPHLIETVRPPIV